MAEGDEGDTEMAEDGQQQEEELEEEVEEETGLAGRAEGRLVAHQIRLTVARWTSTIAALKTPEARPKLKRRVPLDSFVEQRLLTSAKSTSHSNSNTSSGRNSSSTGSD